MSEDKLLTATNAAIAAYEDLKRLQERRKTATITAPAGTDPLYWQDRAQAISDNFCTGQQVRIVTSK